MSIQSEINRIRQNIQNAYSSLETKGGTMPEDQNSNNLAVSVATIPVATVGGNVQISYTYEKIPANEG